MASFLDSGAVRAGVFFALAFAISTVGGLLLGDVREGVRTGLVLGLAFAAFAYLFVRPAGE
jgi:hypothetical protein